MTTPSSPFPTHPSPSPHPSPGAESPFVAALRAPGPLLSVELRPPSAALDPERAMEAWIDMHHGVGRLLRRGRFVLFTDDAVGSREEESLQHLTVNLGPDAELFRIVPFLTCKHPLDYCLLFARRAASHGFGAMTVTGGDLHRGPPRCLPRSRDLRERIDSSGSALPLGMWVNTARPAAEQVENLLDREEPAHYFLTQIVSHHDMAPVDRFLEEAERRNLRMPGAFGVFHYRSANPRTLERLASFLPVPADGLTREFDEEGVPADEVTARTIRALRERGIEKVYLSNFAPLDAERRLGEIESRV